MSIETKDCPCGKKMVMEFTGTVRAMSPPLYDRRWKCYGCKHTEPAPRLRGTTSEELNRKRWEQANGEGS